MTTPINIKSLIIIFLKELSNMGIIKIIEAYAIHRIRYKEETNNSLMFRSLAFKRSDNRATTENINIGKPNLLSILIFFRFLKLSKIQ